jgi:hypothetical protein
MTEDERRQKMDFILHQQAQFAAGMQRLEESDERAEKRIGRLERVVKLAIRAGLRERREFRERYNALLDTQIRTEDSVSALRATQDRAFSTLLAAQQKTDEQIAKLVEAQSKTDQNVSRLLEAQSKTDAKISGLSDAPDPH